MSLDFDIQCRGKYYESVDAAVNDYVNDTIGSGVKPDKLDRIVKEINLDLLSNLTRGVTYLKTPVSPLAPRTIKRKGHSIPFLDKGILFNSVKDEILSEYHGIIFIDEERKNEAFWLNYGTPKMPEREFFGLSDEVLRKIDAILLED